MLQFPAFMTQYPLSIQISPTTYLLTGQWPHPQNDEILLSMEESELDEKVFNLFFIPLSLLCVAD